MLAVRTLEPHREPGGGFVAIDPWNARQVLASVGLVVR
jgi:hypothetical protein